MIFNSKSKKWQQGQEQQQQHWSASEATVGQQKWTSVYDRPARREFEEAGEENYRISMRGGTVKLVVARCSPPISMVSGLCQQIKDRKTQHKQPTLFIGNPDLCNCATKLAEKWSSNIIGYQGQKGAGRGLQLFTLHWTPTTVAQPSQPEISYHSWLG